MKQDNVLNGTHIDWKTWKIGMNFPGNFEHNGKVREFYIKYWKSLGIVDNLYF